VVFFVNEIFDRVAQFHLGIHVPNAHSVTAVTAKANASSTECFLPTPVSLALSGRSLSLLVECSYGSALPQYSPTLMTAAN